MQKSSELVTSFSTQHWMISSEIELQRWIDKSDRREMKKFVIFKKLYWLKFMKFMAKVHSSMSI